MERPQYVPTSSNGNPSAPASTAAPYSASPSPTGMNPLAASKAARTSGLGAATDMGFLSAVRVCGGPHVALQPRLQERQGVRARPKGRGELRDQPQWAVSQKRTPGTPPA
ncbi:hypothetical protein GCM10009540_26680 [Streptomyces turgidiscabies]